VYFRRYGNAERKRIRWIICWHIVTFPPASTCHGCNVAPTQVMWHTAKPLASSVISNGKTWRRAVWVRTRCFWAA
jgi:hypothetical protein